MDATGFFHFFGVPSLFLMACMAVVLWVSRKKKHKPINWIATWGGSASNQSPLRDSRHANSARYFLIHCHRRLHTIFSKERIIRWVRDDVR